MNDLILPHTKQEGSIVLKGTKTTSYIYIKSTQSFISIAGILVLCLLLGCGPRNQAWRPNVSPYIRPVALLPDDSGYLYMRFAPQFMEDRLVSDTFPEMFPSPNHFNYGKLYLARNSFRGWERIALPDVFPNGKPVEDNSVSYAFTDSISTRVRFEKMGTKNTCWIFLQVFPRCPPVYGCWDYMEDIWAIDWDEFEIFFMPDFPPKFIPATKHRPPRQSSVSEYGFIEGQFCRRIIYPDDIVTEFYGFVGDSFKLTGKSSTQEGALEKYNSILESLRPGFENKWSY